MVPTRWLSSPFHTCCAILNRKFGNRWIGRTGNHKWPPRSPDLTPLDFSLWGKLKADVYHNAPTTKEDMRERIQRACAAIDQDTSMCNTVDKRFRQCLAVDGHHFEPL
ncbi:hypothetical protein ALC57_18238 [Trachymyrmex cornetzi]|uniref:Uncharacterized protein n=1 Tax=Trachymyrmex cornetzi TaxID=471704 RepID=A0A195DA28_9HYME|nr:hypothetical protein ALC57_18238 [Trachymyrmex cornetzi]